MFSLLIGIIKSAFLFTGSYSNNIFPDPLSTEDEEKYLNLYLNNKDKTARDKLIEHNLRLVAHVVKKYETTRSDIDDLISIGIIGLIKGIDTYSHKHNTRLATYCARCIDNEILMHFRSDKKNNKNISIDESVGYDKDGNEITFMDILKTPKPDFIEDIHIQNNIKLLSNYINVLSDREKTIIIKRYGLNNTKELTQKEIAKELNISRSYVSRIEKRALTKLLREFIRNNQYTK
ncbi:MAG: RNA polymerase sporulation sigma factor SigK [Bacilli bacterium]|nr:RNA polymerase sporulation sigma factor SigK [Bacilli bacterium]MBO6194891.1 RNA polymerase sporulation sigma factor SigK [Bacilli bacterium]